ncbi:MAG: hypothetical protein RH860_16340 [Cytophagales bacterium]
MEAEDNKKKPLLLKIIMVILILGGLSATYTGIRIITGSFAVNETTSNYVNNLSMIEKISPFIINPLLIISAILLLLGKKRGVKLYLAYLVLVTILTLKHLVTSLAGQLETYKIITTSISFGLTVLIYIYLRKLDSKQLFE